TYTPLVGEEFAARLLAPISIDSIMLFQQAGWSADRLLLLTVQRANDVVNAPTAGGPTPAPHRGAVWGPQALHPHGHGRPDPRRAPAAHLPLPALPPPATRADRSSAHAPALASPHQVGGALGVTCLCWLSSPRTDVPRRRIDGGRLLAGRARAARLQLVPHAGLRVGGSSLCAALPAGVRGKPRLGQRAGRRGSRVPDLPLPPWPGRALGNGYGVVRRVPAVRRGVLRFPGKLHHGGHRVGRHLRILE